MSQLIPWFATMGFTVATIIFFVVAHLVLKSVRLKTFNVDVAVFAFFGIFFGALAFSTGTVWLLCHVTDRDFNAELISSCLGAPAGTLLALFVSLQNKPS